MNYLENMPQDIRYQTIDGASLCVPDMSLSLNEIVKRFASGQLVAAAHNVSYDENASIDDINETERPDFDISDAQKISDGIKQRLESQAAAKAEKERSDAEAAKAAEIKLAVDAALAELQAKTGTPVSE